MREPELDKLAGPDEVAITDASQTLAELGITIEAGLRVLTLIIPSGTVSWADGEATAGANDLFTGSHELHITAARAATLEFVVASGTAKMSVVQEGVTA